ncbi:MULTISPECIES: hypothetical protein [Winkia]|uniref:Uncharacterized protein n=2 Tax=Actinomycetaceae TaxID=2049 RepID=A0AB38XPU9_9ACTO|nr:MULTISPECIES: hypothetical protein [Winkia]MDK6241385.1 hypothetical protein [Winkia sp. UMB10116]WCE46313.1 hypothetical protein PIG85_01315 [Winkia neuii subsp. anitrata]
MIRTNPGLQYANRRSAADRGGHAYQKHWPTHQQARAISRISACKARRAHLSARYAVGMGFGTIPDIVSAVCAALAGLGALISWWRSNLSRRAKADAELARREAAETLAAVKSLAASLEAIRKWGEIPPLTIEWVSSDHFRLRNNGDSPVRIEEIANPEEFFKLPFTAPIVLEPGAAVDGDLLVALSSPDPSRLVVVANGELITIPFTGRP